MFDFTLDLNHARLLVPWSSSQLHVFHQISKGILIRLVSFEAVTMNPIKPIANGLPNWVWSSHNLFPLYDYVTGRLTYFICIIVETR